MDRKIHTLLSDIARELKADYWGVTEPETTIDDYRWSIEISSCRPGDEWDVSICHDEEIWILYIGSGIAFQILVVVLPSKLIHLMP